MILHICERHAWEQAQLAGAYRPVSLEQEGFIHASRPDQVLAVANRFYRSMPDLVLLCIDPQCVQVPIRDEPADGDTYPHIYGPLNLDAVRLAPDLVPGADGFFHSMPVLP